MRRAAFVRQIRLASKRHGIPWRLIRQGAEHEIWACGGVMVALPRHRELTPGVMADVRRKLEAVLGEGWWR